jgi:hypothetical protein
MTIDRGTDYFGPPHMRKRGERQVATPLGLVCKGCGESITVGDAGTFDRDGRVIHYECHLRTIIGSVGHQHRRCTCYGGNEGDPPGMTRRDAAVAAVAAWIMGPKKRKGHTALPAPCSSITTNYQI